MRKPRGELMEEIARRASIAHAGVVHRQCAARGERLREGVDCRRIKLIDPARIVFLEDAAGVAVAKKYLFAPLCAFFHFMQLLKKRNRTPPCPTKKTSDLCRR